MKEFRAEILINAPVSCIWDILIQTAKYPEWDPSCDRVEGSVQLGAKIKVFSKLSPGRSFPVKVTALLPGEKMIWSGGVPLGLFKGVRTFHLIPQDNGAIRFQLSERFSGPLLPLIGRAIPDLTKPFEAFAAGLKQRAEIAA